MDKSQLLDLLKELYAQSDEALRDKFNRSLPFQDGLFDRWERATRLGFGKKASIYNSSCVFGDVTVGESSWIGPNTILDGSGGVLQIGSFCSVSSGVHIYTHDSVMWSLSGGQKEMHAGAVSIGDRVYIGSQSVIAPDVNIGSQSVIGANSFVKNNVEPKTIVAGSPAVVIGRVEVNGEKIKLAYDRDHKGKPGS